MRTAAALAFLASAIRAAAQDPTAVVDKAIRVTADSEERLAKQRFTVQTGRATFVTLGGDWTLTREAQFAFPDRLRYTVDLNRGAAGRLALAYTLNGLKGWAKEGTETRDLGPVQYQTFREEMNFVHVTSLLPLKDRATRLTAIPGAVVDGKMTFGVQADRPGMSPVQLYFEPAGKLVKASYKTTEAGVAMLKEYFYGAYKEFEGIQKPTRAIVNHNGKKAEDWTFESYRFPQALPDATFGKPQ